MSSLSRSIKRGMMFKNMNAKQKKKMRRNARRNARMK